MLLRLLLPQIRYKPHYLVWALKLRLVLHHTPLFLVRSKQHCLLLGLRLHHH